MKITLLGSLGNINRYVVPALVAKGHEVTVITSSPERVPAIETLGATAAVGTMTDEGFLAATFQGSDVVYLMISGTGATTDLNQEMTKQGQIFRKAVMTAGIKRIVQLSSIGAEAGPEAGSLYAYHFLEKELAKLSETDIAFVRPVGFYNNLFSNLTSLKEENKVYSNLPADLHQKFVSPEDIAAVVESLILSTPTGITSRYVVSDTFTMADFLAVLARETGKPQADFIAITDEQLKAGMLANHVPEAIITAFIKTSEYQRTGKTYDPLTSDNTVTGKVKLADFVSTFAGAMMATSADHRSRTIVDQQK